jgi:hypothetical protein
MGEMKGWMELKVASLAYHKSDQSTPRFLAIIHTNEGAIEWLFICLW